MSYFGYDDQYVDPNGLQEGELVRCMIYAKDYPKVYLNHLGEINQENQKNAEVLGIDFTPMLPNHKDGGILWRYAVIARDKNTGILNNNVLIPSDNGLFDIPSYPISGQIEQLSPSIIIDKDLKPKMRGFKEGQCRNGLPSLINILPSPYMVKSKSGILAKDYALDDFSEESVIARSDEKRRIEAWQKVLTKWMALSEDEAYETLNKSLAARYGIMRIQGTVAEVVPIRLGTTFTAKISSSSPYMNIDVFKTYQIENRWVTDIYTKFDSTEADEEDEYFASMINASFASHYKKKAKPDPEF